MKIHINVGENPNEGKPMPVDEKMMRRFKEEYGDVAGEHAYYAYENKMKQQMGKKKKKKRKDDMEEDMNDDETKEDKYADMTHEEMRFL